MGEFLNSGMQIIGDKDQLLFINRKKVQLLCEHYHPSQNIYSVTTRILNESVEYSTMSTVNSVDFDVIHKRFGHPSNDVLRHMPKHLEDFPSGITVPKKTPPCRGCAEGKMPSKPFPPSSSHATRAFEKVHSDLKEFPTKLYYGDKWFISFLDNYTSNAWIMRLKQKSDTEDAIRTFMSMVENQFSTTIKEWQIDGGGEFALNTLQSFLCSKGIRVLKSLPHEQQQNGCAERFNRTIMDKAQAIRLDACLPQMWWNFAVEYAVHIYNRTPVRRLEWRTPFEVLYRKSLMQLIFASLSVARMFVYPTKFARTNFHPSQN